MFAVRILSEVGQVVAKAAIGGAAGAITTALLSRQFVSAAQYVDKITWTAGS